MLYRQACEEYSKGLGHGPLESAVDEKINVFNMIVRKLERLKFNCAHSLGLVSSRNLPTFSTNNYDYQNWTAFPEKAVTTRIGQNVKDITTIFSWVPNKCTYYCDFFTKD